MAQQQPGHELDAGEQQLRGAHRFVGDGSEQSRPRLRGHAEPDRGTRLHRAHLHDGGGDHPRRAGHLGEAQPRQGYVSSLAVDPTNPLVAYATYSTYNSGANVGHVFKTINGGAAWTRIDATLPDMPVHSVVVHPTQPDTLYIGTDLGVFVTTDGGGSWLRENTGFANVVVEHLELNGGWLYAFTHGRSAFRVQLAP